MKIYPLLIILALMAAPLSAVELGVGCEQKFELFDKTAGRPSMMFYRRDWVNALGCDRRTFYTIFLLRDRAHKFESLNVHGNWVARLYENMPIERYETLEDSAESTVWIIPDHSGRPNSIRPLPPGLLPCRCRMSRPGTGNAAKTATMSRYLRVWSRP